jgi:hypothetical protein
MTPIYSDVKWERAEDGLRIYGNGQHIATIPMHEMASLTLAVVEMLKANARPID